MRKFSRHTRCSTEYKVNIFLHNAIFELNKSFLLWSSGLWRHVEKTTYGVQFFLGSCHSFRLSKQFWILRNQRFITTFKREHRQSQLNPVHDLWPYFFKSVFISFLPAVYLPHIQLICFIFRLFKLKDSEETLSLLQKPVWRRRLCADQFSWFIRMISNTN